jgi:hypothetical protein
MARKSASSAKSEKVAAEVELQKLQNQLAKEELANAGKGGTTDEVLKQEIGALLAQDVAWPDLVGNVGERLPAGVWLTSMQGQVTQAPPPVAAPAPPTSATAQAKEGKANSEAAANTGATDAAAGAPAVPGLLSPVAANGTVQCAAIVPGTGTVALSGVAQSYPSLASFIDALRKDTDIAKVWVASAQQAKFGSQDMVTFTLSAELGKTARGHRLETFIKEQPCK